MKTIAFTAFLLFGAAASAQAPTTDWAPNETVVVTAQGPGPAFWHIRKGDSEIWILGTVSPMPKGMAWNSTHLAEIIDGSRVVLTAPTAKSGLFETSWFLLTHRGLLSMPDDKKLEDSLPADLRARFVAARTALNLGPEKFDDDPPILAAQKLINKYNEKNALVSAEPWVTVRRIAGEKHVPIRSIGEYGALGLVKEMLRLPPEKQQLCLEEAVAYSEYETAHNLALTSAWAVGNLKEIKAHFVPPILGMCVKQSASFGKIVDHSVVDYLKVIHEALGQPGKAVMLTDIGSLLRSTGVAEQLKSEGIVIEGPGE